MHSGGQPWRKRSATSKIIRCTSAALLQCNWCISTSPLADKFLCPVVPCNMHELRYNDIILQQLSSALHEMEPCL